jgi:hypothetical protein
MGLCLSFFHNKRDIAIISSFANLLFTKIWRRTFFSCFGGFTLSAELAAQRAAQSTLADLVDDRAMVVDYLFLLTK